MNHTVRVSIIDQVSFKHESDDQLTLTTEDPNAMWRPKIVFKQMTEGLYEILELIRGNGEPVPVMIGKAMQTDGMAGLDKLRYYLQMLGKNGFLKYRLEIGDTPFASLLPQVPHFRYEESRAAKDTPYVISRFAYCRHEDGEMLLKSPLSYGKIMLHHANLLTGLHRLARPCTVQELAEAVDELNEDSALTFLNFLANAGSIQEVDDDGLTKEDHDPSLAQWAFHDLVYHANSRMGRHSDPYGGTFHFTKKFDPPPAIKKPMSDDIFPLFKPDMERLKREEVSYSQIQEMRQSIRQYGEAPITADQLGEFLYRTARIKKFVKEAGVSWRPSPGGGAIHELEIYPVINRCQGLEFGVYHYNPLDHYLSRVNQAPEHPVQWLLELGGMTGVLEQAPQVMFVLTARFQRIQIKYQSVAYAVILKNVGCLYQTMYLVATAMGLAPCALGGGDSDLFARIAGLNYYEETSVGEFLLGSGPAVRPEPLKPSNEIMVRAMQNFKSPFGEQ